MELKKFLKGQISFTFFFFWIYTTLKGLLWKYIVIWTNDFTGKNNFLKLPNFHHFV